MSTDEPELVLPLARPVPVFLARPVSVLAYEPEVVDELVPDPDTADVPEVHPVPRRAWPVRAFFAVCSVTEWLFGLASVVVGLAVLAAVPVAQFLSLGYLLESAARVARTGRVRDGFIGVRLAARLGGVVFGTWLVLLPARFLADFAYSAQVIDPGGPVARQWRIGLFALIVATLIHVICACGRGGKLRYFAWPFNFVWVLRRALRGGYYAEARDAVWDTAVSLRLPYYLWLGVRGFGVGLAWLAVPATLIAVGRAGTPGAGAVALFGALVLVLVLQYLPFLQVRMAAQNRFRAGFQVLAVRREYRRAPLAYAVAFVASLAFALPLYLLKVEVVPREAAWLPGLVFIGFIYPARLLTGWAVGRAAKREKPRHFVFRWLFRVPFLPAAAFYVMMVYFSQYTTWNGVAALYEQHAFLLPVPLLGG